MTKQHGIGEGAGQIRPDADTKLRREMARTGDVGGILELLTNMRPDAERLGELLNELSTAIGVKAERDPEGFARQVYAQMVASGASLLFRSQHFINLRIEAFGRAPWGMGKAELPADIEAALARLRDLQAHVGELLQGQATVARLWELTRSKRLENDGAQDGAAPRSRRPRNGRPAEHSSKAATLANGHSDNRIAGLLDGMTIGRDGVDHDG